MTSFHLCPNARFTLYQLDGGYTEYAVANRALGDVREGRIEGAAVLVP